MIVMPCASCVLLVFLISSFTAVIVFIIWIIIYLIARSAMTIQQEPTTYVSDRETFKYDPDIIFMLFYALIVLVVVKITDFCDNFGETSLHYV